MLGTHSGEPFLMKLPAASCGVSKRNCAEAKPAFTRRKRRVSSLQQAAGYFGEGE
jgi:hypothetical protein